MKSGIMRFWMAENCHLDLDLGLDSLDVDSVFVWLCLAEKILKAEDGKLEKMCKWI